ncbi:hypothetical protein WAG12_26165 [Bacillus cereus]|uniref:hypothetical protein n=1 Tax=Bacillus tropicus TaxID=2026188 RepID=UPI0013E0E168|nr:hypothetical protein [Bacillus tropicus]QIE40474.1 hypothetical protein GM610_26920 [Bacillus tropicus]
MLNKLMEMDENIKEFLYKQLFEKRNAVEMDLIFEGENQGYSQEAILNALDIFMYNGLINKPPLNAMSAIPGNYDFFISDTKFIELKSQGYL